MPHLHGNTMLEKMEYMESHFDWLRSMINMSVTFNYLTSDDTG
ncbi:MAG: hypothetical protein ACTSWX_13350 [Promethearchaeota archaeon]